MVAPNRSTANSNDLFRREAGAKGSHCRQRNQIAHEHAQEQRRHQRLDDWLAQHKTLQGLRAERRHAYQCRYDESRRQRRRSNSQ